MHIMETDCAEIVHEFYAEGICLPEFFIIHGKCDMVHRHFLQRIFNVPFPIFRGKCILEGKCKYPHPVFFF